MRQAILMSIRPEWVAKILDGEKTIEIRKTAPKCGLPVDVYIYCTKQIPSFTIANTPAGIMCLYPYFPDGESKFGGKVVAKFRLSYVSVPPIAEINGKPVKMEWHDNFLRDACLTWEQFISYCGNKFVYAWEISDLVIFDKPKELSEFGVNRVPQSWQYLEVKE